MSPAPCDRIAASARGVSSTLVLALVGTLACSVSTRAPLESEGASAGSAANPELEMRGRPDLPESSSRVLNLPFAVPAGLAVELVATANDVSRPLAIAFDGKGRLYVLDEAEGDAPATDRFDWRVDESPPESSGGWGPPRFGELAEAGSVSQVSRPYSWSGLRSSDPGEISSPRPTPGGTAYETNGPPWWRSEPQLRQPAPGDATEEPSARSHSRSLRPLVSRFDPFASTPGNVRHERLVDHLEGEDRASNHALCVAQSALWVGTGRGAVVTRGRRERRSLGPGDLTSSSTQRHLENEGQVRDVCLGVDGRIYASVRRPGSANESPRGVVVRLNPDGTSLEVHADGFCDPQDLVFDAYGNLFVGDDRSAVGEASRWVHVVDGGHAGWNATAQGLARRLANRPSSALARLSRALGQESLASLPSVADLPGPPRGAVAHPGTGLSRGYVGYFFVCTRSASSEDGRVSALALRPHGATFHLIDAHDLLRGLRSPDVDFGPDGSLYFSDLRDPDLAGAGRIYRLIESAVRNDPILAETRALLADGFEETASSTLAELLGHPDARVRLGAQLELAGRMQAGFEHLREALTRGRSLIARLHAVWGVGIVGRRYPEALNSLVPLLYDPASEVRAQVTRIIGEARAEDLGWKIVQHLSDPSPRVRFFAALTLARTGDDVAIRSLVQLLRENGDQDPYIRHAAAVALSRSGSVPKLLKFLEDRSPSVRLGIVIALRHMESEAIARFLSDPDPTVSDEALRAVVVADTGLLARLMASGDLALDVGTEILVMRSGEESDVHELIAQALNGDLPIDYRLALLEVVSRWVEESGDLVGDDHRTSWVGSALRTEWARLLRCSSMRIQVELLRLLRDQPSGDLGPDLLALAWDLVAEAPVRVAAFEALERVAPTTFLGALLQVPFELESEWSAAVLAFVTREPSAALLAALEDAARNGSEASRRRARLVLDRIPESDRRPLSSAPDRAALDSSESPVAVVEPRSSRRERSREKASLEQGDVARGERLFLSSGCHRCHRCGPAGGSVASDLGDVGRRRTREELRRTLFSVFPRGEALDRVVIDGDMRATRGQVIGENETHVELLDENGQLIRIARSEIAVEILDERARPHQLEHLSMDDIEDLVEFLAGQTLGVRDSSRPPEGRVTPPEGRAAPPEGHATPSRPSAGKATRR